MVRQTEPARDVAAVLFLATNAGNVEKRP